jgi:hypothetical protein
MRGGGGKLLFNQKKKEVEKMRPPFEETRHRAKKCGKRIRVALFYNLGSNQRPSRKERERERERERLREREREKERKRERERERERESYDIVWAEK